GHCRRTTRGLDLAAHALARYASSVLVVPAALLRWSPRKRLLSPACVFARFAGSAAGFQSRRLRRSATAARGNDLHPASGNLFWRSCLRPSAAAGHSSSLSATVVPGIRRPGASRPPTGTLRAADADLHVASGLGPSTGLCAGAAGQ